ncbi:MAG: CNNM domain-containing protein [Candidatus Saccharimonadales bacterium]
MNILLAFIEVIILVLFSASFSGLNVGVMSLHLGDLERKAKLGNSLAQKVLPLRQNSHLSLAAILLSNVASISITSLVLDQYLNGVIAGVASTLLIVTFGEIIPQAFFTRSPLYLCAKFAPLLKIIIFITYPIAKLLQILLDKLFGKDEPPQLRSRHELGLLISAHAGNKQSELDDDEVEIVRGALLLSEKRVRDIMTPIAKVYWLNESSLIDGATIDEIKMKGYSRIPVLGHDLKRSFGILRMKDLFDINFDEEAIAAKDLIIYTAPMLGSMMALDTLFRRFLAKRIHLFPVEQDDTIIGIVTIEDLIEEILQHEIEDETDFARAHSAS